MWAPRRILATIAARDPYSRAEGGASCPDRLPMVRPMKDLREVPANNGNPSPATGQDVPGEDSFPRSSCRSQSRDQAQCGRVGCHAPWQPRSRLCQLMFHQRNQVGFGWQTPPLPGLAAGVHQHYAASQFSTGRHHLRIPLQGADVVDNFRACGNGRPGDGCLIGVHRDDRVRTCS